MRTRVRLTSMRVRMLVWMGLLAAVAPAPARASHPTVTCTAEPLVSAAGVDPVRGRFVECRTPTARCGPVGVSTCAYQITVRVFGLGVVSGSFRFAGDRPSVECGPTAADCGAEEITYVPALEEATGICTAPLTTAAFVHLECSANAIGHA